MTATNAATLATIVATLNTTNHHRDTSNPKTDHLETRAEAAHDERLVGRGDDSKAERRYERWLDQ